MARLLTIFVFCFWNSMALGAQPYERVGFVAWPVLRDSIESEKMVTLQGQSVQIPLSTTISLLGPEIFFDATNLDDNTIFRMIREQKDGIAKDLCSRPFGPTRILIDGKDSRNLTTPLAPIHPSEIQFTRVRNTRYFAFSEKVECTQLR